MWPAVERAFIEAKLTTEDALRMARLKVGDTPLPAKMALAAKVSAAVRVMIQVEAKAWIA